MIPPARHERLVELLHLRAASGGSAGGGLGRPLHGDAILLQDHDKDCRIFTRLRCTCWQRSLTELDRALAQVKLEHPVHHGHLAARHLNHATVRRQVWYRYGRYQTALNEHVTYPIHDRGRTPPTQTYDCILHVWAAWVDSLIVTQALDLLAAAYQGEVWLPTDAGGGRGTPLSERDAA